MAYKPIESYELGDLETHEQSINSSGANPIIDAVDQEDASPFVGAGNVLQIACVLVQGETTTKTLVKIKSSGGDLLASGYVTDTNVLIFSLPGELEADEGLTVELGGAVAHHVNVVHHVRQR